MNYTGEQVERFHRICDSLMRYANRALGVDAVLIGDSSAFWEPEEQGAVSDVLWNGDYASIISGYVAANPDGFDADDLAVASSWKDGLATLFIIQKHDGGFWFSAGGYAFQVLPLNRDIDEMFESLPTFAYTALLPFEGGITYASTMHEFPCDIDKKEANLFSSELCDIIAGGSACSTADEFLHAAPLVRQKTEQNCVDWMMTDLEDDLMSATSFDERIPGYHRGRLAGLSEEEREKADEELSFKFMFDGYATSFLKWCRKGEPKHTLHDLLMLSTKDELIDMADWLEADVSSSMKKAQLVDTVQKAILGTPSITALATESANVNTLRAFQTAVRGGGRFERTVTPTTPYQDVLLFDEPFLYAFRAGDKVTYVMPDELVGAFSSLDWEDQWTAFDLMINIDNFAKMVVQLRGMVPMDDLYEEWLESPVRDGFGKVGMSMISYRRTVNKVPRIDRRTFARMVDTGVDSPTLGYTLVTDEGRVYVVDSLLSKDCDSVTDFVDDNDDVADRRHLTQGMIDEGDVISWKTKQPAAIALRNLLEEYVPNDAHDEFFAGTMVTTLVTRADDAKVTQYIEDLISSGNEAAMRLTRRLSKLILNLDDSLPQWDTNGWSSNELYEMMTGRKQFYNPDGTVMKIGRNDPCPCGSGKKYKNCHGRSM